MRAIKKKTSIYQFLEESGVLEKGTDEEITQARRRYWREYKREWRRQKRRNEKELTPSFTKDELKLVKEAAKKHHRSPTRFIKESAFAYLSKSFVTPNELEFRKIKELLLMNYNSLEQLIDEHPIAFLGTGKKLHELLMQIEKEILTSLSNPKTIEELIIESVKESPSRKEVFIKLLEKL